jgi:hypothetical protein
MGVWSDNKSLVDSNRMNEYPKLTSTIVRLQFLEICRRSSPYVALEFNCQLIVVVKSTLPHLLPDPCICPYLFSPL